MRAATRVSTPTRILGVTLGLSAAANLAATWGDWPWVVGGLAATGTVPMAMHLWPHIATGRDASPWAAVVRWIATAVIVATGAAVTVVHTVQLLTPAAPVGLALAIVASVELLGVMAAMAAAGSRGSIVRPAEPPEAVPARPSGRPTGRRKHQPVRTMNRPPARPVDTTPSTSPPDDTGPVHPATTPNPVDEPVDGAPAEPVDETPDQVERPIQDRVRNAITTLWDADDKAPSQRVVADAIGVARSTIQPYWPDALAAAREEIEAR